MDKFFRDQQEWAERARAAQAAAAQAFSRLLVIAETRDSGQARMVGGFVASVYDGDAFHWNAFDLRRVDVGISDDMLACLDCLRWGKADLCKLVPDGEQRILQICKDWGLTRPQAN